MNTDISVNLLLMASSQITFLIAQNPIYLDDANSIIDLNWYTSKLFSVIDSIYPILKFSFAQF